MYQLNKRAKIMLTIVALLALSATAIYIRSLNEIKNKTAKKEEPIVSIDSFDLRNDASLKKENEEIIQEYKRANPEMTAKEKCDAILGVYNSDTNLCACKDGERFNGNTCSK